MIETLLFIIDCHLCIYIYMYIHSFYYRFYVKYLYLCLAGIESSVFKRIRSQDKKSFPLKRRFTFREMRILTYFSDKGHNFLRQYTGMPQLNNTENNISWTTMRRL